MSLELKSSYLDLLVSQSKLDRDKAIELLKNIFEEKEYDTKLKNEIADVLKFINETFSDINTKSWESVQSAFMCATVLQINCNNVIVKDKLSDNFQNLLRVSALKSMSNKEVGIRLAAGNYLGAYCRMKGYLAFRVIRLDVIDSIKKSLDNSINSNLSQYNQLEACEYGVKINNSHSFEQNLALQISFQFKKLDTWLICLRNMIEGCGKDFQQFVDLDFMECLDMAIENKERFVRESCCRVLETLAKTKALPFIKGIMDSFVLKSALENLIVGNTNHALNESFQKIIKNKFLNLLIKGVSDEWGEVCLPASIAIREFLLNCQNNEEDKIESLICLLPVLCYSRYNQAQGVQRYSQETWMLVSEGKGKNLVEKYFSNVFNYYLEQLNKPYHNTKETSLICLTESITKLDKVILKPFIPQICSLIESCSSFYVWSTRDHALTLACRILESYPEECLPFRENICTLAFMRLEDNIPIVRESGALLLNLVLMIFKNDKSFWEKASKDYISRIEEAFNKLVSLNININPVAEKCKTITTVFKELVKTEQNARTCTNLQSNPHLSESSLLITDADASISLEKAIITDSSVSTSPDTFLELKISEITKSPSEILTKIEKINLVNSIGQPIIILNSDRSSEIWEIADGHLCLLRILSSNPQLADIIVTRLLAKLASNSAAFSNSSDPHRHFYLQSLCKQLPDIFLALGKNRLKKCIELFFDLLFISAIDSKEPPVSEAGKECFKRLTDMMGRNFMEARVMAYNKIYLRYM